MLSKRLQAIADMVPPCRRLIDIGTDHAFLPIELVGRSICRTAVAADLRPGPLRRARQHVDASGLRDQICLCLSDGLDQIDLMPDDVIVIAGLGGLEMIHILERVDWQSQTIILQPMKSAYELRLWLAAHGFTIRDEQLADEGRHIYPLLRLTAGQPQYELSDLQAFIGPVLLRRQPAGFGRYLKRRVHQLELAGRGRPQLQAALSRARMILAEVTEEVST